MELNNFHFADPYFLLVFVAAFFVVSAFFMWKKHSSSYALLKKHIDEHLLKHFFKGEQNSSKKRYLPLVLWSIVWLFLTLALAAPRWSYREVETFSSDESLVILLDLSESMNASDIKPTRLVRAKQKVHDLLKLSESVKIGLIAFAADPHMIAAITDDKETIASFLPSLDTDLVYVKGSRLTKALEMAESMLESESFKNKAVLIVSDGGFEDASAIIAVNALKAKGTIVHAMGVGTEEGIHHQSVAKEPISHFTRLEKEKLQEIASLGGGKYLEADYSDRQLHSLLLDLKERGEAHSKRNKTEKFWDEKFYLAILMVMPALLWWFKRGAFFTLVFIFFFCNADLTAFEIEKCFKNSEELAKDAFEDEDFEQAENRFQDPYRKGVACYKAGKFKEAEEHFKNLQREEVKTSACYNLGNAYAAQGKLKEAIKAYSEVLKQSPDHTRAKENLEVVKSKLQDQKNNQNKNKDQDKQDQDKQDQDQDKQDQDKQDQDKQDQDQNKDQEKQNQDQNKDQDKQDQDQNKDQDKQDQDKQDQDKQDQDQNKDQEKQNQDKQDQGNESLENKEEDEKPQENEICPNDECKTEAPKQLPPKSEKELDADQWLNRLECDPKGFLKNKFYIESKLNGTKEGTCPW